MDIIKLKARRRNAIGKSYTRKARLKGWIPAIYYGKKQSAQPIEIDAREFAGLDRHKKLMHLIDLGLNEEGRDSIAIIKEVQRDVINTYQVLHVDFQHVAMDEKVSVSCPIELIGTPIGVTEQEGVLGQVMRHLTIECFPADIPEKIQVDVSNLRLGDTIHVKDIVLEKATIKNSPEEVVAVITHATREVSVEPLAAAEATAAEAATAAVQAAEGESKEGGAAAEDKAKADKGAEKTEKTAKTDKSSKGEKPAK